MVLQRVFSYQRNYAHHTKGLTSNVYIKYHFNVHRRNFSLYMVPSMHTIARGERQYLGEEYYKLTFNDDHQYQLKRHLVVGTIPHHRTAMPTILDMLMPDFYGECVHKTYILSPFNIKNKRYYRYQCMVVGNGAAIVTFRPKLRNTQLIRGKAYVDFQTGQLRSVVYEGEYDMIAFKISAEYQASDGLSLIPTHSNVDAEFKFAGNHIITTFDTRYDCGIALPDSILNVSDMALMDSVRPMPLNDNERNIYRKYLHPDQPQADTTAVDSTAIHSPKWRDVAWDLVDDNLLSSIQADNGKISFRTSPLVYPQYLAYSRRHGLSYKMLIGARYNFSPHRYLTLNSQVGYNFKLKQFFFKAPLRMTYNPKREGYAEILVESGNRVSNSSVLDEIRREHLDTLDLKNQNLDFFRDTHVEVKNNIEAFDWLTIMARISYHRRVAVNKGRMIIENKPTTYKSFAPALMLKFRPWQDGPVLTADYERGIKGVWNSDIAYERWEFDAVWKKKVRSMSTLNFRLGSGFYTHRNTNYFVDYSNFRDNNLPEGWDDEWTGQFQLVDARWYNASTYYVRGNFSFESPLLFATWLPLVGRYIETERLYFSTLLIEHTRPYQELGYGFTCRYFSVGLFGSFLSGRFHEFGSKFTIELFRKW